MPSALMKMIKEAAPRYKGKGRHAPVPAQFFKRNWKNLGQDEKLERILHYALLLGSLAFTLNLRADRAVALLNTKDAKKRLADEINRQAKKVFGKQLAYLFAFEFDDDGRLHVHGTVVPDDSLPDFEENLAKVLKSAAGKIVGGAARFQLDLKPLSKISRKTKKGTWTKGWDRYIFKDAKRTMEQLNGGAIFGISRAMNALAQECHDLDVARNKDAKRKHRGVVAGSRSGRTSNRKPLSSAGKKPVLIRNRRPTRTHPIASSRRGNCIIGRRWASISPGRWHAARYRMPCHGNFHDDLG